MADRCGVVDDLPVEIRQVDGVEVDQPDRADACGREIQERGRPESAGADAEHPRRLQPALAVLADLRQQEMAAIALTFARGQIRQRHPASVLRA